MSNRDSRFFGDSLALARRFRGLTQTQLADASGCSRSAVVNVELGTQPHQLLREAFAEALDFPLNFFLRPPPLAPSQERLHFRKQASVSVRSQQQIVARGAMLAHVVEELSSTVALPEVSLPRVDRSRGIEAAADACRSAWGIPADAPLMHVGRALEAAGIMVGLFSGDAGVAGFSWVDGRPFVMVNDATVYSRRRLTIGHELGHLVLHQQDERGSDNIEEEAFDFASAFLVPRRAFMSEFPRPGRTFDWRALVQFKQRWGIAIQAALMRGRRLGLVSAPQLRQAFIQLGRMGWRKSEPGESLDVDVPGLLPEALKVCTSQLEMRVEGLLSDLAIPKLAAEEVTGVAWDDERLSNVIQLRR